MACTDALACADALCTPSPRLADRTLREWGRRCADCTSLTHRRETTLSSSLLSPPRVCLSLQAALRRARELSERLECWARWAAREMTAAQSERPRLWWPWRLWSRQYVRRWRVAGHLLTRKARTHHGFVTWRRLTRARQMSAAAARLSAALHLTLCFRSLSRAFDTWADTAAKSLASSSRLVAAMSHLGGRSTSAALSNALTSHASTCTAIRQPSPRAPTDSSALDPSSHSPTDSDVLARARRLLGHLSVPVEMASAEGGLLSPLHSQLISEGGLAASPSLPPPSSPASVSPAIDAALRLLNRRPLHPHYLSHLDDLPSHRPAAHLAAHIVS